MSLSPENRALVEKAVGYPLHDGFLISSGLIMNRLLDAARSHESERVKGLEAESAELTKALTGLTCGGSEFFVRRDDRYVADVDACVAWVQRVRVDAHQGRVKAIRARNAAEARARVLQEALEQADRALTEYVWGQPTALHGTASRIAKRRLRLDETARAAIELARSALSAIPGEAVLAGEGNSSAGGRVPCPQMDTPTPSPAGGEG